MDGILLRKIVSFINRKYTPFAVNGVYETSSGIEFECFKDGIFFINFNFMAGMIFFPKSASGVVKKLPFLSKGTFVKCVSQKGYDRIIEFELLSRKASGKLEMFYMIGEFPGSNGNMFILNDQKKIIYSNSSNNIDKDRDIGVGRSYTYFKRNKIKNIDTLDEGSFKSFAELEGFYPPTAAYCDNYLLKNGFYDTLKMIESQLNNDFMYVNPRGKVYPFKLDESCRDVTISDFDGNISKNKVDVVLNEKTRVKKFLNKKISGNLRIIQKLEKELSESLRYDEYRELGELLKSNYELIKNSDSEVTVLEYKEDGAFERKIDAGKIRYIDGEINKLFLQSRKLKRSVEQIKKRMADVKSVIKELEEEVFNLEMSDAEDIKYIYKNYFSKEKNIPKKDKNPFRIKYLKHKDVEILVGKNSRANHELVFHLAKGDDYWFHAKDYPSAHVIVRNSKAADIDEDLIIFAARLAGSLSKGRANNIIDIDYTSRKYVKKPKKTPEGFVIYSNFKTVSVRPFSDLELKELGV